MVAPAVAELAVDRNDLISGEVSRAEEAVAERDGLGVAAAAHVLAQDGEVFVDAALERANLAAFDLFAPRLADQLAALLREH